MKNKLTKILLAMCCAVLFLSGALFAIPQQTQSVYAGSGGKELSFKAVGGSVEITFGYSSGSDVQFLKSGTSTWEDCPSGTVISLSQGEEVSFVGINVKTSNSIGCHFAMTSSNGGKVEASGDVTSLTNGTGGDTTLTDQCYVSMFEGCSLLTKAPNLPATTMKIASYGGMFKDCTGLTSAPALPATTLATACYNGTFNGCANLITAPALPATILATSCYYQMFFNCTSLTEPADMSKVTTLASSCCSNMYRGCTGIKMYTTNATEGYQAEWKISNIADVSGWSTSMFNDCGSDNCCDKNNGGAYPTVNTTYYIQGVASSQQGDTPSTGVELTNASIIPAIVMFMGLIALVFVINKRKMFN